MVSLRRRLPVVDKRGHSRPTRTLSNDKVLRVSTSTGRVRARTDIFFPPLGVVRFDRRRKLSLQGNVVGDRRYIDLEMCRWTLTYPYPPPSSPGRPSRRVLPQPRHPFRQQTASFPSTWSDMSSPARIFFSLPFYLSFPVLPLPPPLPLALRGLPEVYPSARAAREPSSGAVSYRGQPHKK